MNESAGQVKLVFHRFHPPHRADDKALSRHEVVGPHRSSGPGPGTKSTGFHAIVNLRDTLLIYSSIMDEPTLQIFAHRRVMAHERTHGRAQRVILPIATIKIVNVAAMLAVDSPPDAGEGGDRLKF